jgi:DNA mismatch endonuclease (patch repair protein)
MKDNLTLEQRSKCMSSIRSTWTHPEQKIHSYLKANKIKHEMHPSLTGKPDVLLLSSKTAIFLQGCFWHKCPKCYVEPKTRKSYWLPKIARNVERDKKNVKVLKSKGYKVLSIWEHDIKSNFERTFKKIEKYSH